MASFKKTIKSAKRAAKKAAKSAKRSAKGAIKSTKRSVRDFKRDERYFAKQDRLAAKASALASRQAAETVAYNKAFASAQVHEQDKGWKSLLKRLGNVLDAHVDIGAMDARPEIVARMRFHEFGTETVLQRSFLRSTFAKNKARYKKLAGKLSKAFAEGKMTDQAALEYLGDEVTADVQATIGRTIPPPLKEATLKSKKRKGYSRPLIPLIATGEMLASIGRKFGRGR